MKRYEGLFILNTAAKEDGIKDTLDKTVGGHCRRRWQNRNRPKMERKTSLAWPTNGTTPGSTRTSFYKRRAAIAALRSKLR